MLLTLLSRYASGTLTGCIILWSASVPGICSGQTAAERAEGTTAVPQVLAAQPQITLTPPRPTLKRRPAKSAATSSAPGFALQLAPPLPEIDEVTVNGRRAKSVQERARFYIETRIPDAPELNMAIASGRQCADESVPIPKRIASCDLAIWKLRGGALSGASLENAELAKIYVARAIIALQNNGNVQSAIQDINTAARIDRSNPRPWIELGNFYAARADYLHALEDYNRALSIAPDDPVANNNRGIALESLGRHAEAIAAFTRAISLEPKDSFAYSNRAASYRASRREDLAIADLTAVIGTDPSNGPAYYDRGTAYELSGDVARAMADYREAVRRMPAFAAASAALGRLDSKDDPQQALAEFGAAIRLNPKSPALRARALLYLALAQPERALSDLDRVIANDASDAIAWADRGVAKSKLGDVEGAIADCTRAIELAPTVANRINRGNAYATLHRDAEALADFDMALQEQPRNIPALIGRANANYASKHLAASMDDFTRILEADPQSALAYFKRGNIHLDLKEFASAWSDYSESLKIDPNQAQVLLNRSIAAARLGHRTDAAKDQRHALSLDPYIFDDRSSARKR